MKLRHSPQPALVQRMFLSTAVLLAGIGFVALATQAAGSMSELVDSVLGGRPSAPGFMTFVLGVVCIIYGGVGLLFRRDDH